MRCYFQVNDGPWQPGECVSLSGGAEVVLSRRGVDRTQDIVLCQPSILFHDDGLTVFGFVRMHPGTYQACSVQVRLRKPRVPESAVRRHRGARSRGTGGTP